MNQPADAIDTLKARLKTTWTAGDYGQVAKGLEASALAFLDRVGVNPGEKVLDVACGAGQLAIPAARAGAKVTGIDIAENSLQQARRRASSENLPVQFDIGDAEDLPYDDASFDLTISLIGAMFAPRPDRVSAELKRVTRPGGRIVMGNWPTGGFVAEFFGIVSRYVAPPDGMPSPLLWGDEATVRERLADGTASLEIAERPYIFDLPYAPQHVAAHYERDFGPVNTALNSLDKANADCLRRDLLEHWQSHNEAQDGTTRVQGNLLEIVAIRE